MSWNAGQILSIRPTIPSPAVTGSVLATFLISATASFKRWQARCDPFHPNARERSRDLNVHVCFAAIAEDILAYGADALASRCSHSPGAVREPNAFLLLGLYNLRRTTWPKLTILAG
jgi:hypothetical protein